MRIRFLSSIIIMKTNALRTWTAVCVSVLTMTGALTVVGG